jgi:hypothetical protein
MNEAGLKRYAASKRIPLGVAEKDYVLSVAIMQLSKSQYAKRFVFKGGTAIKKVYYPEARRNPAAPSPTPKPPQGPSLIAAETCEGACNRLRSCGDPCVHANAQPTANPSKRCAEHSSAYPP